MPSTSHHPDPDAASLRQGLKPIASGFAETLWLRWWALVLLAYAVFGKGISYIGVAPVYLGEFTLLTGVMAIISRGVDVRILANPTVTLILAVMGWGMIGTLPNIPDYGIVALRDGALWGYGSFALIVAVVLRQRPGAVDVVLRMLRVYAPTVIVIAPLIHILGKALSGHIPHWPGSFFPLIYHKPGDVMVHLAIAYAAVTCGAVQLRLWPWAPLWSLAAISVLPFNRGGTVVLLLVGGLCLLPKEANRRWPAMIVGLAAMLLAFLAITDIRIELHDFNRREISFQQISDNVSSLLGGETAGNQGDTARWRLRWWEAIIDRLPEHQRAWTGLGFGPDISRNFGVMDTPDDVRSPHNVIMTIYARMGLVGLILWTTMLVMWLHQVAAARFRARHDGDQTRLALLTTIMIAMPGLLLNACVDIYLEGPAGGVWFWSLIGVGIALSISPNQNPVTNESKASG